MPKETAELVIQNQESGNSSTSNNSSRTKTTRLVETPPNLLHSPVATSKKKMSPQLQGKNIKDLPPFNCLENRQHQVKYGTEQ